MQNLDSARCKGAVFTFFLRRAKRTKKHARTCKKLPVASFCASETAETGRIANGREQGDHVSRRLRFASLWTPGTIQSSAGKDFVKLSGGSCRNRFFAQNSSEKALNRCDAPALQHKIRAKSKRTAAFFANSRLRVVEMGGGGWKRVALDRNKERFVQKKSFWFAKMGIFLRTAKKGTCKRSFCT